MSDPKPLGIAPFAVDVSELKKLAYYYKGQDASRIVSEEILDASKKSGNHVLDAANRRIPNKSGKSTGRLANSGKVKVRVNKASVTTTIIWNAKSDTGYPYAPVIESGRKAFGPITAKALSWVDAGGKRVFAKWVKAYKGNQFASRGLAVSQPQIMGEFQDARTRIVQRIESLPLSGGDKA